MWTFYENYDFLLNEGWFAATFHSASLVLRLTEKRNLSFFADFRPNSCTTLMKFFWLSVQFRCPPIFVQRLNAVVSIEERICDRCCLCVYRFVTISVVWFLGLYTDWGTDLLRIQCWQNCRGALQMYTGVKFFLNVFWKFSEYEVKLNKLFRYLLFSVPIVYQWRLIEFFTLESYH